RAARCHGSGLAEPGGHLLRHAQRTALRVVRRRENLEEDSRGFASGSLCEERCGGRAPGQPRGARNQADRLREAELTAGKEQAGEKAMKCRQLFRKTTWAL